MNESEIRVTFTSDTPSRPTESMHVSSSVSLQELTLFAAALLNIDIGDETSGRGTGKRRMVQLFKDGRMLYSHPCDGGPVDSSMGQKSISHAGIKDGDLIFVRQTTLDSGTSTSRMTPMTTGSTAVSGGGGALDFSSLLSSSTTMNTATSSNSNMNSTSSNMAPNNGGLTFNIPSLFNSTTATNNVSSTKPTVVKWKGMSLDQAISSNPDPAALIELLLDPSHQADHGNLIKEMTFHYPRLAKNLKEAPNREVAVNLWRGEVQKSAMNATISRNLQEYKDKEMEQRLQRNPMDAEANAYFGEKIRKRNVEQQYQQMMEEYPESIGRVLMLYIDAEVNGHKIQAFVDSGAQSTIMSSQSAERCGLLHLLDTRFEGVAVGVGTGKILGRVHVVPIRVNGHFFPCSITIMDSEEGLGDKNMDFLLGLDMLKRHRCNIDLERNVLIFNSCSTSGGVLETPFLHEKDLTESKGGTKDFNAEASNMEIDRRIEEMDEEAKKRKTEEK